MPYAVLSVGAAVFLCVLFLDIPIGTEAREYVFYHGYLATHLDWSGLILPVGSNRRLISLLMFALGNDVCGLGTECLNGLQILLLLLCLAMGAVHLNQLLRRPAVVAMCVAFWCFSLPVFQAGYWQATQHDKLACLFSLAALSLGLAAIRRGGGLLFVLAANLVLTGLFLLAINSKEIAFYLPAAVVAQLAFLMPQPGWPARRRAARIYALPMAYAVLFILVYMIRLNTVWQGHVMSGSPIADLAYYAGSLTGRVNSSPLLSSLFLTIIAAFGVLAVIRRRSGAAGAWAYLLAIFAANLVLVIRAQYPDNFYLLLAEWAATGWVGASFVLFAAEIDYLRIPGMIGVALLACLFLVKRAVDFNRGSSGELLHEARSLSDGYHALTILCGQHMRDGVKFVFSDRPLGLFYFFWGGDDGQDQLVGAFICQDGTKPAMSYVYDGNTKPDHPGQLVVRWTKALKPFIE